MDTFLTWLDKYELLIELIITVLTIVLSLWALFQTGSIANQQADIQERQIKISVYEQKNEINKALNIVFDSVDRMILLFNSLNNGIELKQITLYQLLKKFIEGINFENISYTLEQSQFFIGRETYLQIRMVRHNFMKITTSIECLDLLKEDDETKNTLIEEIQNACAETKNLQPTIKSAMIEELKFM